MDKIFINSEEALKRYYQMIKIRIFALVAFLAAALFLKEFFQIPFPNLLFSLVSFMAISTVIYDFLFRQIRNPKPSLIINCYFAYMLFDLIILTIIIYVIGGVTWIGFIFYGLYIYIGFLLFPRAYSIFYIFYCSFLYTALVIMQYFGVLPLRTIFSLEERVPQNTYYVLSTWMASVIFLWVLGVYGNTFYQMLQGKIEELQKTKQLLEEEKASLGIKVRARVNELWEERKGLEKKVKERTKELEKERQKLAERISELEKFYKVAVGRELKIRELKEEIEKLQKTGGAE